ncbi:MAG TPA: hypothetical protein PKZ41_06505, partial [Candidatus Omnitrophota bacterium]|nr:hypothetical protein [Candidatus Omnitrophota bacterium]
MYRSRLHAEGRLSLESYWDFLVNELGLAGGKISDYPVISSFVGTVELEREIDFEKATAERKQLIDRIMETSPAEAAEEL